MINFSGDKIEMNMMNRRKKQAIYILDIRFKLSNLLIYSNFLVAVKISIRVAKIAEAIQKEKHMQIVIKSLFAPFSQKTITLYGLGIFHQFVIQCGALAKRYIYRQY